MPSTEALARATVAPELLLIANQAIENARGSGVDTLIVVSRSLRGQCSSWNVVPVYHRLEALTLAFKGQPSNEFVINAHGRDYKVMNEVLFHAAAIAPMTYIEAEQEYVLDRAELMAIAQELWNSAA